MALSPQQSHRKCIIFFNLTNYYLYMCVHSKIENERDYFIVLDKKYMRGWEVSPNHIYHLVLCQSSVCPWLTARALTGHQSDWPADPRLLLPFCLRPDSMLTVNNNLTSLKTNINLSRFQILLWAVCIYRMITAKGNFKPNTKENLNSGFCIESAGMEVVLKV